MARIPESEIERLKNEVSVARLVEAAGIELKKAGKDLLGRCPFHEDDTASLVVAPGKNLWHCFGCGVGGGPIDWIIKQNGVSFRHAVELLREGITSLAAEPVKRSTVRKLDAPVEFDADDQALLNQVVDYYHETLKQSPEALAYLEARGLRGAARDEAIATFKLGYANRTLGLCLPSIQARQLVAVARSHPVQGRQRGIGRKGGLLIQVITRGAGQRLRVAGRAPGELDGEVESFEGFRRREPLAFLARGDRKS